MGSRSGAAGSGGIRGRMSPGGAGEPPPNPVLESERYKAAQKMIAGYSTTAEAIEGGKALFKGGYGLQASDLSSVKAHQEIQSTLLENAARYGVPLKELGVAKARNPFAQAAAVTKFDAQTGKLLGHTVTVNPEFFQRGYKDVRKEGSIWNATYGVTGMSKNPRKTLLDHEFGHVLQARTLGKAAMDKLRGQKPLYQKSTRSLSKYSRKNRLEEHAEAFAAYKMGMRSKRITRILRSLKPDS